MEDRKSYLLHTNHYTLLTPSICRKKNKWHGIGDGGVGKAKAKVASRRPSFFLLLMGGMDEWMESGFR